MPLRAGEARAHSPVGKFTWPLSINNTLIGGEGITGVGNSLSKTWK